MNIIYLLNILMMFLLSYKQLYSDNKIKQKQKKRFDFGTVLDCFPRHWLKKLVWCPCVGVHQKMSLMNLFLLL